MQPRTDSKVEQATSSRLSQEFYKLLQLHQFTDSFLDFLKARRNSEILEYVFEFEQLQKETSKSQVQQKVQSILDVYIREGSSKELNLPFGQRAKVIERILPFLSTDQISVNEVMECLSQVKDYLLLQLKEERFQEFKKSEFWEVFQKKLNEPKLHSYNDFSFLWVIPVKQWSPKQVSLWLKSMNIEENSLFEEHEVCGDVLSSISRDDLISMGITKIASIKRILRLVQEVASKK